MAKIKFLRSGTYTTVQDMGRKEFYGAGIPRSGCLDFRLLYMANALLMNDLSKSCLEYIHVGPKIEVEQGPIQIAVTGDFAFTIISKTGTIQGVPNRTYTLVQGDIVDITSSKEKIVGYLSFKNFLNVDTFLNSQSMTPRYNMGHNDGQPFSAGQELHLSDCELLDSDYQFQITPVFTKTNIIRVFLGPQFDFIENGEELFTNEFKVSNTRDRIGLGLEGPSFVRKKQHAIVTSIPSPDEGAIQAHPNGKSFVMCADKATHGGYPHIAVVSKWDYYNLIQMPAGTLIKFTPVEYTEMVPVYKKFKNLLLDICHSDNLGKIS